MIQTTYNQALKFSVDSSTVRVNPGTARIGTSIIPFRGGSMGFEEMTSLTAGKCQYSALALTEQFGKPRSRFVYAELTSAQSPLSSDASSLLYPKFDTTNFSPVGLFLFSSDDGVTINLIESSEVTK